MRLTVIAVLLAAVAAGCGGGGTGPVNSCYEYYNANPPGLTPQQIDFCLNATGKVAGNCCVQSGQCQSNRCCGWNQTCGSNPVRESCECY